MALHAWHFLTFVEIWQQLKLSNCSNWKNSGMIYFLRAPTCVIWFFWFVKDSQYQWWKLESLYFSNLPKCLDFFFSTSHFQCGKLQTLDFRRCQKIKNWKISHTGVLFQHLKCGVSNFWIFMSFQGLSNIYWESHKPLTFRNSQSVQNWRNFADTARFQAPRCKIISSWLCFSLDGSMRKLHTFFSTILTLFFTHRIVHSTLLSSNSIALTSNSDFSFSTPSTLCTPTQNK